MHDFSNINPVLFWHIRYEAFGFEVDWTFSFVVICPTKLKLKLDISNYVKPFPQFCTSILGVLYDFIVETDQLSGWSYQLETIAENWLKLVGKLWREMILNYSITQHELQSGKKNTDHSGFEPETFAFLAPRSTNWVNVSDWEDLSIFYIHIFSICRWPSLMLCGRRAENLFLIIIYPHVLANILLKAFNLELISIPSF